MEFASEKEVSNPMEKELGTDWSLLPGMQWASLAVCIGGPVKGAVFPSPIGHLPGEGKEKCGEHREAVDSHYTWPVMQTLASKGHMPCPNYTEPHCGIGLGCLPSSQGLMGPVDQFFSLCPLVHLPAAKLRPNSF